MKTAVIKYKINLISFIKHLRHISLTKPQISFCYCNQPWI